MYDPKIIFRDLYDIDFNFFNGINIFCTTISLIIFYFLTTIHTINLKK